ncbi:alpha/beta fold hydrolase [Actinacidiphila sp. ITFR-21]|uniref:thioesterase domain-containing protein n=1 Tax=Actinacidiphila sp. ITFR-21 TaxID=3075199 RepID=UPI00288A89C0|nr:alpha/beta fold hydrolase [Streptomyces sp. ITFR-21]WNI18914.1 alpha/beta fold hydrolase [Streptomyces sp. ITFR-21]
MPTRPRSTPQVVNRYRTADAGGRTVFVVHPGALPATVHRTLAAALPEGSGLTVLDLSVLPEYWEPALTGDRPSTTVEDLAARLLDLLLTESPQGPSVLVGWSFGGVVAHTMTGRLPAAALPDRLVLLDSIAPTEAYTPADSDLDQPMLLDWFAMYLGAKRDRVLPGPPDRYAGHDLESGLAAVLQACVTAGALPADTSLPGLRKLYDTYVDGLLRNNRLTAAYRPQPAVLPLVLLKADRSLIHGDPDLGWPELAAHGLSVLPCPGDHYTMLTRSDSAAAIAHALLADASDGIPERPAPGEELSAARP